MTAPAQPNPPEHGQLLIYSAEDGRLKIDVRLQGETVWLTQQHMADLFQTTKQNIGQHLKNIFEEAELAETSVVKNLFTTASDGKQYRTNHYNLDAIISAKPHEVLAKTGPSSSRALARARSRPDRGSIIQIGAEVGNQACPNFLCPNLQFPGAHSPKFGARLEVSQHRFLFAFLDEFLG